MLYRLEKIDEAHQATIDAIEIARADKNREKEVNFLLSLGESYMLTDKLEEALETYQQALDGAQRLQRQVDRAYLSGRIGVILAELGRADEAIGSILASIDALDRRRNGVTRRDNVAEVCTCVTRHRASASSVRCRRPYTGS